MHTSQSRSRKELFAGNHTGLYSRVTPVGTELHATQAPHPLFSLFPVSKKSLFPWNDKNKITKRKNNTSRGRKKMLIVTGKNLNMLTLLTSKTDKDRDPHGVSAAQPQKQANGAKGLNDQVS